MNDHLKELTIALQTYYPYGMAADGISTLVEEKINQINEKSEWSKMVEHLGDQFGQILDMSFIQFPNRKVMLTRDDDQGDHLVVKKNFSICLSLLCKYYTYFYEYEFFMRTPDGSFHISSLAFLTDRKSDLITRNLDLIKIENLIKGSFPFMDYISHYELMVNKVKEHGVPFGASESIPGSYSFYQYLFDRTQPVHVFH